MGQGKTLAVFGGLVVALVGGGLWFALDGLDGGGAEDVPEAPSESPAPEARPETAESRTGRRRAKVVGTCTVTGTVRRRKNLEPAEGQTVELVREGADPWSATCDAGGAFAFAEIPDGGPYEVRVTAAGFAPVRLPGIALSRNEQRDVGTLWLDRAVHVPVSVRTTSDLPVEGAVVEAFAAPDTGQNFDWTKALAQIGQQAVPVARAVTDAQGKAAFDGIAGGTWSFVASKPGLAREGRSSLFLRGGDTVPEVRIYLGTGHALRGRVLDGEKKPLAGALVLAGRGTNVWDFSGSALRVRATADAEGRYALTDLPAGDLAILAGRAGGVPAHVAVVRVPAVKEYEIVLRSGGTLTGTVTDSKDGKPIEGAVVRASAWGQSVKTAEATTDAAGKYRIESAPDGQIHDVRAEKEGYVPDRRNEPPWMQPLTIPAGDTATKDLRLRRGAVLRGTVTGPAGPLAGARVNAQSWNPQRGIQWQKSASTDASGKYELVGAEPGKVLVQATKEGHYQKGFPENAWMAMQQPNLAAQWKVEVAEAGETTFDVKLDLGVRVEGRVEGPDGPLEGAKVGLGGASTVSGADGAFVLEGVAPGRPWIHASKEGFLDAKPEQITVDAAAPTTGLVRRMVRQPVVRGRVTSAAGVQLLDAQVSVFVQPAQQGGAMPVEGWGPQWGGSQPHPVRPDGTYEAPLSAVSGKLTVRAAALDHAMGEGTADLSADRESYEVDVALEVGGAVKGRVVAQNGAPVPGAAVTVRRSVSREQQQMVWNGMQQQGVIVAVSGADGAFVVEHVAAGTWDVTASAEGYVRKPSPAAVKVPGGGDVVIEMDLALEMAGKVLFADGSPAVGVSVHAQKDGANDQPGMWGPGGMEAVTTDASGGFRIRSLAPGNYRLQVQPSWAGTSNVKNKRTDLFAAGTTDVRIVVEAGGVIAGRVVNAKKEGLSGVWINANRSAPDPNDPYGQWRSAMTKDDGTFELVGLSDGAWNLNVQPNQGTLRGEVRQNVAPGTRDLEIALDEGLSIEGIVQKSDGSPVEGVWLYPQPKPDPANPSAQMGGGQGGSTDADGKFTLTGLAPGRYAITIQQWNNPAQNWLLLGGDDVAAGTTGVRLTVTEGEKIAGIVVDEAGSPIAGASVNAQANNQWRHAQTGSDGKFEVSGLPASDSVRINVNAPGRIWQQLDKVTPGTRDLRIVLEKGLSVTGRLVDASGSGSAQARLTFRKKGGGGGRGGGCVTDGDGKFTCEGLQEGEYDVSLMRRKADNNWETVAVGSCRAGDSGVDLRIP